MGSIPDYLDIMGGCPIKTWCININNSSPACGIASRPRGDAFRLRFGTVPYFHVWLACRYANKLIQQSAFLSKMVKRKFIHRTLARSYVAQNPEQR